MLNFGFQNSNGELTCSSLYHYLQHSLQNYISNILEPYPFKNKTFSAAEADCSGIQISKFNHYCTDYFSISGAKQELAKIKEICIASNMKLILEEDEANYLFLSSSQDIIIHVSFNYSSSISASLTYFSSAQTRINDLKEECLKLNNLPKKENNFLYSFCQRPNYSAEIKKVGQHNSIFYPENYNNDIAENYPKLIEKLSSSAPDGRLLILEGPPGTGKSHFIRSLTSSTANEKTVFILLDYQSASSISGAELLNVLLSFKQSMQEKKSITFLIEDADHFLHTRSESNMSVISSLLNLTDGMLGEALDVRVIASTNIPLENLETALTRPGRLMDHLRFGPLETLKASKIFQRLTGQEKTFSELLPLCEIYHQAKQVQKEKVSS